LPVSDAQKKGKKGGSLIEKGFFHAQNDQRKLQKLTVKLTFEPQKGPKTPEQSTKNVDLCVKHKVRKEKSEE